MQAVNTAMVISLPDFAGVIELTMHLKVMRRSACSGFIPGLASLSLLPLLTLPFPPSPFLSLSLWLSQALVWFHNRSYCLTSLICTDVNHCLTMAIYYNITAVTWCLYFGHNVTVLWHQAFPYLGLNHPPASSQQLYIRRTTSHIVSWTSIIV